MQNVDTRKLLCVFALALAVLPVVAFSNLPFVDYPNHLARYYILHNLPHSPELAKFYTTKTGFHPYWALRGSLSATAWLVGVENAARLASCLSILVPVVGVFAVSRALHGRFSLLPLASIVIIYSEPMAWGFQNYMISVGVALISFALWIRAEHWTALSRIVIFAIVSLGITCLHFLAAVVFIMLIGGWFLAGLVTEHQIRVRIAVSRLAELLPITLPTALLFLALRDSDIGASVSAYSGWRLQVSGMVSPLWMGWNRFELLIGLWMIGILAVGFWSGVISISRRAVILLSILVVCATFAPFALFGVGFINMRLPIVICLFLIAACGSNHSGRRIATVLTSLSLVLTVAKFSVAGLEMNRQSNLVSEMRSALEALPKGQRIFSAMDFDKAAKAPELNDELFSQISSYAVIDAHAFVPRLFAMYEVGFTPEFAHLSRPISYPVNLQFLSQPHEQWPASYSDLLAYARNWRQDYDFLLFIDFDGSADLPVGTTEVHKGTYFRILRIDPA